MRNGVARPASEGVSAERTILNETAKAPVRRVVSLLLAVLLALQVGGLRHHKVHADAKAIALASLGAAIGQPVTLCEHDGDRSRPDDPAAGGSCEYCIFCHAVAVGLAPKLGPTTDARLATQAEVARPRGGSAFVRAVHRGAATPRGPPAFG